MNLQVVHVGAVGVHLGADGMPGTVNEVIPVAGFPDVIASCPVDLPPRNPLRIRQQPPKIRER